MSEFLTAITPLPPTYSWPHQGSCGGGGGGGYGGGGGDVGGEGGMGVGGGFEEKGE